MEIYPKDLLDTITKSPELSQKLSKLLSTDAVKVQAPSASPVPAARQEPPK